MGSETRSMRHVESLMFPYIDKLDTMFHATSSDRGGESTRNASVRGWRVFVFVSKYARCVPPVFFRVVVID